MSCSVVPIRWLPSWLIVVGLLSVPMPAWAGSPPAADVVSLPDGERVQIGEQGPMLLQAAESGTLEDVLRLLVDAGRSADGAAALIYVARHRPDLADGLAALGLALLAVPEHGIDASALLTAIADAAQAAIETENLSKVVGRPSANPETEVDIAALRPASGPPGWQQTDAPPPVAGQPTAPVSYGSGGGGGGSGGAGGGLPAGLFIGSGGGVGSNAESGVDTPPATTDQTSVDPPVSQPPVSQPPVSQQPVLPPDPGVVDPPADGGVS
jgi:hypothetical protein